MWLALIMAFNVWVIIWPNQKKVLGHRRRRTTRPRPRRRAPAMVASRINILLSIPMLLAMTNFH